MSISPTCGRGTRNVCARPASSTSSPSGASRPRTSYARTSRPGCARSSPAWSSRSSTKAGSGASSTTRSSTRSPRPASILAERTASTTTSRSPDRSSVSRSFGSVARPASMACSRRSTSSTWRPTSRARRSPPGRISEEPREEPAREHLHADEREDRDEPDRLAGDRGGIDERPDRDEEHDREEVAERQHLAPCLLRFDADREEEPRNERGERERHAEDRGAEPGGDERRRHRDDEERVLLVADAAQQARQYPVLDRGGKRDEEDGFAERDGCAARLAGREHDGEDRRRHEGDDVLQDRPHEQRARGGVVERPALRARDVHDHDRAREPDREAERYCTEPIAPERDEDERTGKGHERDLRWHGGEDTERLPAQRAKVELDPDLEQQQNHPNVGENLDLVTVGHVSRRERADDEADDEIADDRRKTQVARRESDQRRAKKDDTDLEDRDRFRHARKRRC